MDLRDYLRLLRLRWISILLCGLLAAVAAFGFAELQTKQYASSARLFVSTTAADATDAGAINAGGQFSQARVQSYANLINSRELAATVISKLGLNVTPAALSGEVKASVAVNTVNLTISATNTDAKQAQAIAQAYAESMVALVTQIEKTPGAKTAPIHATIIDSASLPTGPSSPRVKRNAALGLVLGLLVGFAIAYLRRALDTRINSNADLAEVTDRPVLGSIAFDAAAKDTPLITSLESHAPRAEAFRVLRTNLQFVDVDQASKIFVITSAVPDEGKTTTAVNLALALAQAGVKTALVEGDLRRPRASTRLGVDGAVGLTNVLVGKISLADALQVSDETGLHYLASGAIPPNPAELLQSQAMKLLIAELREGYDVVIIDAPPLLPVTDAALLAAATDGALLVVRHGKVTKDQTRQCIERLEHVDSRLVGVVMNMVPAKGRGYGYGYGYGYAPDATIGA